MNAEIAVHPIEELSGLFARLVDEAAQRAIAARGSFSIAIPGGSAAEVLLPSLVTTSIDWSKTDIFWVDERMVPPDDPDSNFRAARIALLDHVAIPAERLHPMVGEEMAYARVLRKRLGEPAHLDVVLLGMGPEGHVASLFPGHHLLRAWDRDVAVLDDAPKPPPRRMTLTLRALNAARRTLVFATGEAKAEAIRDTLRNEDSALPCALATMGAESVTFLLDSAAASRLPR